MHLSGRRFDPVAFLRWLDSEAIRYMLIGGQAVRLYGSPRTTVEYDFWLEPSSRVRVLRTLEELYDLELSADPTDRRRPIVVAQSPFDKVDTFFLRGMSTPDGKHLDFDELFSRSVLVEAEGEPPVRVPAIDDLIALKSLRAPLKPEDTQDIRYLEVRLRIDEADSGVGE